MIARCAIALASLAPLLAGRNASAESQLNLWLSASVDKRVGRRLELSLQEEVRFDQDVSRLEEFFTEVSAAYRAHRRVRADLGFRVDYERDRTGLLARRLLSFVAVRPRYRLGPIELTYRIRYQGEIRGAFDAEDYRHTMRNRLALALVATEPWVPAVSAETFHRLGDGDTIRLQKARITVGVERDLGSHSVELSYRIEIAQDDPRDPTPHIVGLAYQYEL